MVVVVVVVGVELLWFVSRASTLPRKPACPAQRSTTYSTLHLRALQRRKSKRPSLSSQKPSSTRPKNSPHKNDVEKKKPQRLTSTASRIPEDPLLVAKRSMATISTRKTNWGYLPWAETRPFVPLIVNAVSECHPLHYMYPSTSVSIISSVQPHFFLG